MRVIERYATAAVADDLKDRGPYCDLHILTAAGMAGVSDTWATSLFRLKYCNDPKEYHTCMRGLKEAAQRISAKGAWKLTQANLGPLSKRTLEYWISDVCPTCLGRGASSIKNTPMLEDVPCDQCGGTGIRKLPQTGNSREYMQALLAVLDSATARAGSMMMAKLADEINLALSTKSP